MCEKPSRPDIEAHAMALLIEPAPAMTEAGKIVLAEAVLVVKLFYGEPVSDA